MWPQTDDDVRWETRRNTVLTLVAGVVLIVLGVWALLDGLDQEQRLQRSSEVVVGVVIETGRDARTWGPWSRVSYSIGGERRETTLSRSLELAEPVELLVTTDGGQPHARLADDDSYAPVLGVFAALLGTGLVVLAVQGFLHLRRMGRPLG